MLVKSLKLFLLPVIALIFTLNACKKNEDIAVEDATDQALYSVQERGSIGKYGCFELVFPLSITLPDQTTAEVNSYDEIKAALRAYYQANGTGTGRPHLSFVFPFDVVSKDGEVITINTRQDMVALRIECGGTFGNHNAQGHGQHLTCFEVIFPITIQFPDGSTASATDRQAMRQLIRQWHQANSGATTERPKIVFPITVKMTEDGTMVTVNSRQELRELKENCN